MRRFAVAAGLFVLVLSWVAPASAGTHTVSAKDFSFSPTPIRVPQGATVEWKNDGTFSHTATQDDSLDLWDTGTIAPGSTADSTMASAGAFLYHCKFHGGNGGQGMSGVVKVPAKVRPSSGKVGDTFTVTVSTANAPTGFVFDVQRKTGSGSWTRFKRGVKTKSLTFSPSAAGTYAFRSRLRRTSNGGASRFSPPARITVAAA
jgi:plastocyanin